ncbi:MAG: hypothetical protein V1738_01380 [Patescibacteria group bacterium]
MKIDHFNQIEDLTVTKDSQSDDRFIKPRLATKRRPVDPPLVVQINGIAGPIHDRLARRIAPT